MSKILKNRLFRRLGILGFLLAALLVVSHAQPPVLAVDCCYACEPQWGQPCVEACGSDQACINRCNLRLYQCQVHCLDPWQNPTCGTQP